MAQAIRGGKKGRKIGNKKRKPAQMRYTSAKRWITNKKRRRILAKLKARRDAA